MPIYVYQCQQCHAIEEHIQGFNDEPMTTCQKCGGELRKSLTSAAFHLKGGGWYKDGYASSGSSDGASNSPSSDASSGASKPSKDSGSSSSSSGSDSSSGSSSSSSSSSSGSSSASSSSS